MTDTTEKLDYLTSFFAEYAGKADVVFSSCAEEDPEELSLLYRPDIVLLDLEKEPQEFVQILNGYAAKASSARIIAFTDYTRFSFGLSILHLENVYFLPRPVSYLSIEDCIGHIIHEQDALRERDFSPKALNVLLNDYIPIIRQHYLSLLLRRPLPQGENVLRKFETLKIDCPGPYYTVIVANIQTDGTVENFEAISFLLRTNIKSAITAKGYQCYIFFDSEFKINCLIGSASEMIGSELEAVLSDAKNHFEKMAPLQLSAGIGKTVFQPGQIHISFRDAEMALMQTNKEDGIMLFENIDSAKKMRLSQEQLLTHAFALYNSGALEECKKILAEHVEKCKASKNPNDLKQFVIKYILRAACSVERWSAEPLDDSAILLILSRLYSASDMGVIEECEREFSKHLFSLHENTQEDYLVAQALSFINERITDPNLDLEMVSSSIGLSKSYFCKMFHRNMNRNFSNYIRNLRIEKAKVLLTQSTLKAYEISEAVGFTSPKYFSSVFKQVTGMTPSEYQKGI